MGKGYPVVDRGLDENRPEAHLNLAIACNTDNRLGEALQGRGTIREGNIADVTILDPETISPTMPTLESDLWLVHLGHGLLLGLGRRSASTLSRSLALFFRQLFYSR